MTKEQAIEILKYRTDLGYGIVLEHGETSDIEKALDMAIQALEERKQGKWIDRPLFSKCSICGCEVSMCERKSQGYKYCPKCGADIRGGESRDTKSNS